MTTEVLLVSHSRDGHREAYIHQFQALLHEAGYSCRVVDTWKATLDFAGPACFLMIEENFFGYAIAAIVRALQGRRTAGLLFRGREAAEGQSLKLRNKAFLLCVMKSLTPVTTMSIVSFSVLPSIARVADDWIDDPQLWDIEDLSTPPSPLSADLVDLAAGRNILVALGAQNREKGFDILARTWLEKPEIRSRWLFVAAGKVAPSAWDIANAFAEAGGGLVDRYVSDDELRSLYGAATVIWALYAPDYDQASGIFGRAVQYEKPVLLREGSAMANHAAQIAARATTATYNDAGSVILGLEAAAVSPAQNQRHSHLMRERSQALVFAALGKAH
ncbi:hypothetical protein [Brevundimonas sp.]|uniref:hypothetical protein n=1 Tax=Brevundimonas sp. TaxID=1871086 RepID=UPI003BADA7B4